MPVDRDTAESRKRGWKALVSCCATTMKSLVLSTVFSGMLHPVYNTGHYRKKCVLKLNFVKLQKKTKR